MINKLKLLPKKKLILIISLVIMILLSVILLITMAFINPVIDQAAITNVNVSTCGYFRLDETSASINLENSYPMTDNVGLDTDPYSFKLTNSCEENKGFNLYLVVSTDSQMSEESIKVNLSTTGVTSTLDALPEVTLTDSIKGQYQTTTGKDIKKVYLLQEATLVPDLPVTFEMRMWMDKDAGNDQQGKSFKATIMVADGETSQSNILYPEISDICQGDEIASCYAEYNFLDDELLRHTEELANSAADNNYRYSGANPDNYVNFNNELWRIIGIYDIDGKQSIKLVKDESIGNRVWDASNNNDYETSDIKAYLNGEYYNSLSKSSQSLIKESTWYVGGNDLYDETAYQFYQEEIVNPTADKVTTANIGLIYGHDLGFAVGSEYWATTLIGYDSAAIKLDNWLNNGVAEWTISPRSLDNARTWYKNIDGRIGHYNTNTSVAVRPTIYIESDIILESGRGTASNPLELRHPETLTSKCTDENMAECFTSNSYLDETLLQHTSSLANSAGDNNYRYSGSNEEVDNYVCFGSDVSPCPEENKYRIIGIYDGSIKLIKADPLDKDGDEILEISPGGHDTFSWGETEDYETSIMKTYLNGEFYNSIPSNYQAMIKDNTWNVGGNDSFNETAYEFYRDNIAAPVVNKTSTGKIGLMYPSDYGFAAYTDAWTTDLFGYNAQAIKDNNWLFNLESNQFEWTIEPDATSASNAFTNDVWLILFDGMLVNGDAGFGYGIRPTLYLDSSVTLAGGTGTSSDPYIIDYVDKSFSNYLIANHDETNGLLQHTPELANGAQDNNYRYSGSNTVVSNNWVCFGSDASTCPKENKYRIMGIYDESVKLIKATAIDKDGDGILEIIVNGEDTFVWDADNSNDYETSDIKEYLNGDFYDAIPSNYQILIKESIWNVGGNDTSQETPYEFYRDIIAAPVIDKTATGKIGLMYISDYGYGAHKEAWITGLNTYGNQTIKDNNWLYNLEIDPIDHQYEWTIVPRASTPNYMWPVDYRGHVGTANASSGGASRPVLYLESSVKILRGTGTESDPFHIGM